MMQRLFAVSTTQRISSPRGVCQRKESRRRVWTPSEPHCASRIARVCRWRAQMAREKGWQRPDCPAT
eukprot:scaffold527_cov368-Prasinococcus_capsulatus_cf.AAC.26